MKDILFIYLFMLWISYSFSLAGSSYVQSWLLNGIVSKYKLFELNVTQSSDERKISSS